MAVRSKIKAYVTKCYILSGAFGMVSILGNWRKPRKMHYKSKLDYKIKGVRFERTSMRKLCSAE